MLTDFLRDHATAIALFGVMTMAWLGWAQEDPPASWRWRLGAGSVLGVLLAAPFVLAVIRNWRTPSSLDDGLGGHIGVVAIEVVLIVGGAIVLAVRGGARWIAWWVAMVVALHFIPLGVVFGDAAYAILGVLQAAALLVALPRIRRSTHSSSRLTGPIMGGSLLAFAVVSAVVFVVRHGLPWMV